MSTELDTVEPAGTMAPQHRSLSSQLFWMLPVALASLGISVLLWKHQDWGANAAAIIGIPINVAAIIVTILIDRGTFKTGVLKKPRTGSRRMNIALYFTAGMLAISAVIWWWEREPDPQDFLSGEVRVGFVDAEYPGWHTEDGQVLAGFDVNLETYIQSAYPRARFVWVPLGSLDNRLAALRGKWRLPGSSIVQQPVKLVISNFSITPERAELIDFVGPYFVTSQGVLTRAKSLVDIPLGSICVVSGSTAEKNLKQQGYNPTARPSLSLCLDQFNAGEFAAVSDDSSILAGYARKLDLPQPLGLQFGSEEYGIGIPNNMPKLCGSLSKVVNDFLVYDWNHDFSDTLSTKAASGKPSTGSDQKPRSVDPCQSPEPWL